MTFFFFFWFGIDDAMGTTRALLSRRKCDLYIKIANIYKFIRFFQKKLNIFFFVLIISLQKRSYFKFPTPYCYYKNVSCGG